MSSEMNFWDVVKDIHARDSRYAPELYGFVMDGLQFTTAAQAQRRHVSAEELLRSMCVFARQKYGVLAHSVLERWGVAGTSDIGRVVFHLVESGVLARQESDRIEDFDDVLDLKQELEESYFEGS